MRFNIRIFNTKAKNPPLGQPVNKQFEDQSVRALNELEPQIKKLGIAVKGSYNDIKIKDAKLLLLSIDKFGYRWNWVSSLLFPSYNPVILSKLWLSLKIKCGSWTKSESEKLNNIIAEKGISDWKSIAFEIPSKTATFCKHYWYLYLSSMNMISNSKLDEGMIKIINKKSFKWTRYGDEIDKTILFIKYYSEYPSRYPWCPHFVRS